MSDLAETMDDLRLYQERKRNQAAIYFVKCAFGRGRHAWIERNADEADRAGLMNDLISLQIEDPVQIIEVDLADGTSRDVTEDIAKALADWSASKCEPLHRPLINFIHDNAGAAWARELRVA